MLYSWTEFHGAVTHFPVALIIAGFVFEVGSRFLKKPEWKIVSFWSLFAGVIGGVAALISGLRTSLEIFGSFWTVPSIAATHRAAATVALAIALTLLLWRTLQKDRLAGIPDLVALSLFLFAAVGIGYTGYLGGQMVFGHGVSNSLVGKGADYGGKALPDMVAHDNRSLLLGASLFRQERCVSCHTIGDSGGEIGPDLTHEGLRQPSVSWQIEHLINPAGEHPGSVMPSYKGLTKEQLSLLAEFILSKK